MPDPLQRFIGLCLFLVTAPLQAVLALLVRLDTRGPALYRASRVGRDAKPFVCLKLRTMRSGRPDPGPGITSGGDARITRLGRLLRKLRLDELPQLWNVARGQMRIVGPRPEDPRFVELSDPLHREVFTATPGVAGLSQLIFADEARLLADVADPDARYRSEILPRKLRIDAAYLHHRSSRLDLWILAQTPKALLGRTIRLPAGIREELGDEPSAHSATEPTHA
jgi:lipopolysaccharide/colanic/teichoic acid biosynthesis glycosyltransferase